MNRLIRAMRYSLVVVLVMLLGGVATLVPSVPADARPLGDNYPYRTAVPTGAYMEWGSPPLDPWNFYKRNCTSFVAWRLREVNGVAFSNQYRGAARWGNAAQWDNAARQVGVRVDTTPARGAVAQWEGGYGHVAWVAEVRDGGRTIVVEEYNFATRGGYGTRTLRAGHANWPDAFIHVRDLAAPAVRYAGQMVRRPDGAVFLVKEDGRRYHVPSGGDFQALRNNGVPMVNLTAAQVNAIPNAGQRAQVRRMDDPRITGPSSWITRHAGSRHGFWGDYFTTASAAGRSQTTNAAIWTLRQPPGVHRINVFVPTRHAVAGVRYEIFDGTRMVASARVDDVAVHQRHVFGWHRLGEYRFRHDSITIRVRDNRGAGPYNAVMGFDAAELVPLR